MWNALAVCPIFEKKSEVCEYYGTKKSIAEVNESRSLPLTDRVRTCSGMSGEWPCQRPWSAINLAIASATSVDVRDLMSTDGRIA